MSKRYPMPPYPNGWFQVGLSRDLSAGDVQTLRYFGKELVLFRGQDGRAHVLDAFCPHLGAHLGLGKVVDGDLECRFHKWRLAGDGAVTHVPCATRIPPKARAGAWPVDEKNGIIYVWHHAAGEAPTYTIPHYPALDTDAWTPLSVQKYEIRTHCQEIGENVVDKAHFTQLHGMDHPDHGELEARVEGHEFHVKQHMKMAVGPMAGIEVPVVTRTVGPGVAILKVDFDPVYTQSYITQTPIDDERVDAWVNFCMKKQDSAEADEMITQVYSDFLNEQYADDIPIWSSKAYLPRPQLSDFDGPVPLWRKWYAQFYSEAWDDALEKTG